MNETSNEQPSPWDQPGDGHRNQVANAKSCWKEILKDNLLIVLLSAVALSFTLGYFIAQQQEAKKREQWAEILFRQAKDWLTKSGRKTAGSVEHGLEYARSAAAKGAEYSHRLNPFHREQRSRFFGILWFLNAIYGRDKNSKQPRKVELPFSKEWTKAWKQLEERVRQRPGAHFLVTFEIGYLLQLFHLKAFYY
jgi:hypothetical protein